MQVLNARFTLRTARERKKLTQEEAARSIGVSVDTLGNYERGKSYPDVPVLQIGRASCRERVFDIV